jgi:enamine deaminase RidA (YjgF/YER057c/UK114 family)
MREAGVTPDAPAVVSDPPPARTTVYVGLPGELRVEIGALAALPE